MCGNILLFGKIEWIRLVSFYGNHNLTASTALMDSLCLNVLCYSLLIHKGTFLDSFYHFHFFHIPSICCVKLHAYWHSLLILKCCCFCGERGRYSSVVNLRLSIGTNISSCILQVADKNHKVQATEDVQ